MVGRILSGVRPTVQCPRCAKSQTYPESYMGYSGRVKCKGCGCWFEVSFSLGALMAEPRILPPYDIDLPSPPVPGGIKQDLMEAGLCFSVGSPKATVVLCRRALEGAAEDMGAKGRNLSDKLDDLFERGTITKRLHETSTEIRIFGNYGAHPRDDLLEAVDEALAQEVLYFSKDVMDEIYVKPGRLDALKRRREGGSPSRVPNTEPP